MLSLRKDIRNIKESGFSRIKKTIVLFVAAPSGLILIALLNFVDLHGSLRAAYFLLILSSMTLSFNAVTLSALISIITWRTRVHVTIWSKDIILILLSVLFLFCISFLAYFMAFALRMA